MYRVIPGGNVAGAINIKHKISVLIEGFVSTGTHARP